MAGTVTFVVPGDLQARTGGYEYDRRIIDGLRALGWQVTVAGLDGSFPYPTADARLDARRTFASIPDGALVVVDGLAFGALPDLAGRERTRLRLVALVHHPLARETGLDDRVAASFEASERRALESARLVVVTSPRTAEGLVEYGVASPRIAVVVPGTEPAPLARGSRDGLTRLIAVASVVPRKGYDTLIEAVSHLPEHVWTLTCVGSLDRDPDTVARLRARITVPGLVNRVAFVGELDSDTLSTYYDDADVFVLPTWYEGYGMAVAEALARGLPVVSTPTGAIPELVGHEAGLLVPPGDAPALADALARVMSDAGVRARLAAGARAVRERLPSWTDASAQFAAALTRVQDGGLQR
jgi:glycosyltransferase involved in cell wall biosynthesis